MTNLMTFDGNLSDDPKVSFDGPKNTSMATFTVINNERYRSDSGAWVDAPPVAFRCVAFGKLAEYITDTLSKGNRVVVTATYTQRTVEKDGDKRTYNSFKVKNIGPDLTFNTVEVPGNGKAKQPQQDQNFDPWAK